MKGESRRGRQALAAVIVLWVAAAGLVGAGAWSDRASRSSGPEASVLAYASAVERSDLDAALAELVPSVREPSSSWVAWQMGNRYRILESAVRSNSLLDGVLGRADPSVATVVVVMEVEGKGNPTWRAVIEVPARLVDGQWLLTKPPLEGM